MHASSINYPLDSDESYAHRKFSNVLVYVWTVRKGAFSGSLPVSVLLLNSKTFVKTSSRDLSEILRRYLKEHQVKVGVAVPPVIMTLSLAYGTFVQMFVLQYIQIVLRNIYRQVKYHFCARTRLMGRFLFVLSFFFPRRHFCQYSY